MLYILRKDTAEREANINQDPRLARFFDSNKKAIKRAKILTQFIEVAPEREAELFLAHAPNIYTVVERSISFMETLPMKKKESTISSFFHAEQYAEIAEFCNLVKLLQRLVYYCPSKIKDRWNFWSFCRLAGRAVDSNNTPELRQVGTEMLLQFIEGLRPAIQSIEGDSKSDMIDGSGSDLEIPLLLLEEALNITRILGDRALTEGGYLGPVNPAEKHPVEDTGPISPEYRKSLTKREEFLQGLKPYEFAVFNGPGTPPEPTPKDDVFVINIVLNFIIRGSSYEPYKLYETEIIENARKERLIFWYKLVRDRVLVLLYPPTNPDSSIKNKGKCRSIGDINPSRVKKCPPAIQSCLISWLSRVLTLPEYAFERKHMFSTKDDVDFIVEILRQSLMLPHAYAETTMDALGIYNNWVCGKVHFELVNITKQDLIKKFVSHVACAYTNVINRNFSDGDTKPSVKKDLCAQALRVFNSLILEKGVKLSRATWDVVLAQLMEIAGALTANISTQRLPLKATNIIDVYTPLTAASSAGTVPADVNEGVNIANVFLPPAILEGLLKALFEAWARSRILDMASWDLVYNMAPKLLCLPGVGRWKEIMLDITELLNKRLHEIELAVESGAVASMGAGRVRGRAGAEIGDDAEWEQMEGDLTPNTLGGGEVKQNSIASLDVGSEHAVLLWDRMFHVLGAGNPLNMHLVITDPDSYEEAVKAITDIIDLWLGTESSSRGERESFHKDGRSSADREMEDMHSSGKQSSYCRTPHLGTILSIVGPWLFRAAELLLPEFIGGRCAALEAICRIFCFHTDQPLEPEWVAQFCALVYNILTPLDIPPLDTGVFLFRDVATATDEQAHLCVHRLLRCSSSIFGMGYQGFFMLVPHYLRAIEAVLHPSYPQQLSFPLRKSILRLLSSLISQLDYHKNVKIAAVSLDGSFDRTTFVPFSFYRPHAHDLLRKMASSEMKNPTEIRCTALWSVTVDIYQDLVSTIASQKESSKKAADKGLTGPAILNDASGAIRFIQYCDGCYSSYTPRIWLACEKIKKMKGDRLQKYAVQIYTACMNAPAGSVSPVTAELLAIIQSQIAAGEYHNTMFDRVQEEIMQLMEKKLLPKFLEYLKSAREKTVKPILSEWIANTSDNDPAVALTALECLSALSNIFEDFDSVHFMQSLNFSIPVFIVMEISTQIFKCATRESNPSAINSMFANNSVQPRVIASMLYCLCDWLLNENSSQSVKSSGGGKAPVSRHADMLLSNVDINEYVFKAIEAALFMGKSSKRGSMTKEPRFVNWPTKGGPTRTHGNTIDDVLMAAESLLLRLTNLLNAFPVASSTTGIANRRSVSSFDTEMALLQVSEASDGQSVTSSAVSTKPLLFAFQGCILTFMESKDSQKMRFVMRDISGKYIWEWEPCNRDDEGPTLSADDKALIPPPVEKTESVDATVADEADVVAADLPGKTVLTKYTSVPTMVPETGNNNPITAPTSTTKKKLVPRLSPSSDRLSDLMAFVEKEFETTVSSNLNPPSASTLEDLNSIESRYKVQAEEEKHFVETHPKLDACPRAAPFAPAERVTRLDQVRLAFAHLGFLEPSNLNEMRPIETSNKCIEALINLDRASSRECMRIGVLYFGKNQTSERQVMSVEHHSTSPAFNSFVEGLGWEVNLRDHKRDGFFMGSLNPKMYGSSADPLSVYYSTPQTEVMYHVVPRLPLEPTTRQQQGRKKIIAADPVLIIWCERSRDYQPDSIMSTVAQVHIIIYPYKKQGTSTDNANLFRVEICRRSKNRKTIGIFGPLLDGMICGRDILAQLVRQTALNAHRSVLNDDLPYQYRRHIINEITQYYSKTVSEEELYGLFYGSDVVKSGERVATKKG